MQLIVVKAILSYMLHTTYNSLSIPIEMEKERHESHVDWKTDMWHKGPQPKGLQDQRAVVIIMPSRCPPTSRICSALICIYYSTCWQTDDSVFQISGGFVNLQLLFKAAVQCFLLRPRYWRRFSLSDQFNQFISFCPCSAGRRNGDQTNWILGSSQNVTGVTSSSKA